MPSDLTPFQGPNGFVHLPVPDDIYFVGLVGATLKYIRDGKLDLKVPHLYQTAQLLQMTLAGHLLEFAGDAEMAGKVKLALQELQA